MTQVWSPYGAFRSKTPVEGAPFSRIQALLGAHDRLRSAGGAGRRARRLLCQGRGGAVPSRANVLQTTAASLWFPDASSSFASASVTGFHQTCPERPSLDCVFLST